MHHVGFQIGGKTFAMLNLKVEGVPLSFKCRAQTYGETIERAGVIPAPSLARNHLARNQWVSVTEFGSLPAAMVKGSLRAAREAVRTRLSKKLQAQLA